MYSIITDWPRYPPNLSAPKSMTPQKLLLKSLLHQCVLYMLIQCVCLAVLKISPLHFTPFQSWLHCCWMKVLLHTIFFCPRHRWLGVSHRWSSYMIKYIWWAKRLQMKIFIFGFTYVPEVKGQPCLHFSSKHIFSILYHCLFVFWLNYLPQCI